MRAITIWPEWVWAIENLDKNVENRTWYPRSEFGIWPSRLALHAGKYIGGRPGRCSADEGVSGVIRMAERAGWKVEIVPGHAVRFKKDQNEVWLDNFAVIRGAVVAVARIEKVDRCYPKPWAAPGQWQWHLTDITPLAKPVPCRGHQKIWSLPPDVEAAVRAQL